MNSRYGGQSQTRVQLDRADASGYSVIASYLIPHLTNGQIVSASYRRTDGPNGEGAGITLRIGSSYVFYFRITNLPNVATRAGFYGENITDVRVGNLELTPPNLVTGLTQSVSNGVMTANWNAASDDANGIGGVQYEVFRGTVSLGVTSATTWQMPVNVGENFNFVVKALDAHRNFNSGTSVAVAVPPASSGLVDDSRRVGVHAQSVQWGAMGESIDLRSMNLNYTVPLLKAQGRNGMGLGIGLNYNSQGWRKVNSTVTKVGADVGYGFGWQLLAGSVIPVYANPTTLSYYLFTDSTGAQYKLDVNESNVWRGKEGLAVWFDANTYRLYFPDGSFWRMESVSGASEQDAGTRYPTTIQDRNGNQIVIRYRSAINTSTPNSSARISWIDDIRATQASWDTWKTYDFTYNNDAIPHLTGITNTIATGEAYSFNYSGSQALVEPFGGGQQFGTAVWMNSLTQSGVNLTTSFVYNSAGEMTKLTFPLGGEMMWNYTNQSFAGGRQIREVLSRDLRKAPGAPTVNYAFTHPSGDSSLKYHSETTLADPSNVGQRRWAFFTATDFKQGLASKYEELDNWVVKSRSENTWAQTTKSIPYIASVLNTIDVGLSTQKVSKTVQNVEVNGITTETSVSKFDNLNVIERSQGGGVILWNSNYSSRYIIVTGRQILAAENGTNTFNEGVTYDNHVSGFAAMPVGTRLWENPNTIYRALPTQISNGYAQQTVVYNLAGQPVSGNDGQGSSQTITYGAVGGSTMPTQITPNGNTSLTTTMNWNGFLGLTNVSTGSGANQWFGYDAFARPTSKTTADGAGIAYGYNPGASQSWMSINGRGTTTIHDGLGRPVRVLTQMGATTLSIVDTEYEPCACSPIGKVKRVSLPYAPGGTIYWTVYNYDGLGRTVSVAQPNGAGMTSYLYEGNTVRVTSPSGKWKRYVMNSVGRLVEVIEPRPGGGTYSTTYTYNAAGKVLTVTMPRDGVTQTRTFVYDTATSTRLLSATNPENGTVTYTYNPDGTTSTKTDAKGIRTEFSYDAYKRVLQMRKLTQVSSVWTEERCQRTDYFYDEGGGTSNGRLTRVRWNWQENGLPCTTGGGFEERYGYNAAGRILSKALLLSKRINGVTTFPAQLIANWTYNSEGNVTSVTYPERSEGLYLSRRVVNHGFDGMARLNAVDTRLPTEAQQNPGWQSVISNVQFNAFGAVTSLNHLGVTETRQYNVLGQMTRMTKGSLIDMEYRFSATANDGKIISQKNWLNGEDVVYQYDELERLISASTTAGGNWGLTWNYDGFGNRLSQNVSQGSGPANVVLVNGNTNRISSSGYGYDLNGNMTTMPKGTGSMTLNYDLSNRVSSISSVDGTEDYVYAPDNRRVWRSAGRTSCRASRGPEGEQYWGGYAPGGEYPTEQVIFYSPSGQKMGVYCLSFTVTQPTPNYPWPNSYYAVTASEENVYYGGRLVGKRMIAASNGSSLVTDFTADRLQSKGDGSRFYPYGESKTGASGDDREQFATYTRDERSGLDYANQRWYASGVGRFTSVDPNIANANANRGASWNAYAYTEGNPINASDPSGLMGEGCGTWWESARDFGHCGGGPAGSPESCEMYRAGCIEVNGGGALIPCISGDPTSAFFGSMTYCATTTGDYEGDPIGGKEEPECFVQLKYRSIYPGGVVPYGKSEMTHAYLWVQDKYGYQWLISGGPVLISGGPVNGYLGSGEYRGSSPLAIPRGGGNDPSKDPVGGAAKSVEVCDSVAKMLQASRNWPDSKYKYVWDELNSNTFARYIMGVGGFSWTKPPNARAWESPIPGLI